MGCDIHGYVEIRPYPDIGGRWNAVVDAGMLLPRDYDMFGCLFGVRNLATFEPLFPFRGLPEDTDRHEQLRLDKEPDCHSTSWATLAETWPGRPSRSPAPCRSAPSSSASRRWRTRTARGPRSRCRSARGVC